MGQQQSNDLQQSRIMIPKVGQLKKLSSGPDIRYGEIRVMQTTDGTKVAVKTHIFQDDKQWTDFKALADKLLAQGENFMIKLLDLQHVTEKELCTQVTSAHSVFEFYALDLVQEMEAMKLANKQFKEIEILAMIHCVLTSLNSLEQSNRHHGDIRPLTISLTAPSVLNPNRRSDLVPYPVYKVTDIQSLTNMNAFSRCVAKIRGEYNLSPEQMIYLKEKVVRPHYDVHKSDVFSVGVTALQMATSNSVQDIYDYNTCQLNADRLDAHIQTMKKNYSEQFSIIVCTLLQLAPEGRLDILQSHSLLAPYQFQLEDYFNSSTLKSQIPHYSIQFSQQSQRSEIPKLHKNAQPHLILDSLDKLDDRAKEALKRSLDAQLRYQKSPLRQLRTDSSIDPTNNFQNYNQLPQFTIQEMKLLESQPIIHHAKAEIHDTNSNRQSSYYNYQYQPKEFVQDNQMIYHEDEDDQLQIIHPDLDQIPKQSLVEQFDPTISNRQSQAPYQRDYTKHGSQLQDTHQNQASAAFHQDSSYAHQQEQHYLPQHQQVSQNLQQTYQQHQQSSQSNIRSSNTPQQQQSYQPQTQSQQPQPQAQSRAFQQTTTTQQRVSTAQYQNSPYAAEQHSFTNQIDTLRDQDQSGIRNSQLQYSNIRNSKPVTQYEQAPIRQAESIHPVTQSKLGDTVRSPDHQPSQRLYPNMNPQHNPNTQYQQEDEDEEYDIHAHLTGSNPNSQEPSLKSQSQKPTGRVPPARQSVAQSKKVTVTTKSKVASSKQSVRR